MIDLGTRKVPQSKPPPFHGDSSSFILVWRKFRMYADVIGFLPTLECYDIRCDL